MIGKKIKKLREIEKKTQEDLAKFLGVAPQTIYKYEKEINEPDLNTTSKIAEYFNVSVDYLLGRTDIEQIDKKLLDNNIAIAANSKIDLGKIVRLSDKKVDLINSLIDDFLSEDD